MKRYYTFSLQGSWRTEDITAYTLKQAYKIACKKYGDKIIRMYQTCPFNGMVFSGWKQMNWR
jgi:hypothetical protein